jgi:hypothetical protein
MGDYNRGQHPNSRANLCKGSNTPELKHIDTETVRLANSVLDEETEYQGVKMTNREAILRVQAAAALEGNLRACQFIIDLDARGEQCQAAAIDETATPLERLQNMMQPPRMRPRVAAGET